MKNKIIQKPNEIIRARAVNLPLESKRMINAIIYACKQTHFKNRVIIADITFYKNTLNLKNTGKYVDVVSNALRQLALPIIIKNYKDLKTGINYKRLSVAFVDNNFHIKKQGKNFMVKIKINKLFFNLIKNYHTGNYTCLDWIDSNRLSSKHAICLYEYLHSFKNKDDKIKIKLKFLNDLLSVKNLTLSEMSRIIERSTAEIAKKTKMHSLNFKINKKTEYFCFYFEKQLKLF